MSKAWRYDCYDPDYGTMYFFADTRNEAKSIAYCWDSANLEYIAIRVFRCPDLDHLNHESGYEMDWSKEEDRIELLKLGSTCIQTEEDPRESCKYCEASEECWAYEKYLGSKKK